MILEIDVGNTRIKWRVVHDQRVIASGSALSVLLLDEGACQSIFNQLDPTQISHVHIASVAPDYDVALADWCYQVLSCKPVFACVAKQQAGVVNGYKTIAQMGVDRWLALLSAWDRTRSACLVVDAGTAVTVDLLLGNGMHHGGYIVPGLQMMNKALFANTGKVQINSIAYPNELLPGDGTQAAVLSGLPMMLLGLVEKSMGQIAVLSKRPPKLLVTGGDGLFLSQLLKSESHAAAEYIADLVLDGLRLSRMDGDGSQL